MKYDSFIASPSFSKVLIKIWNQLAITWNDPLKQTFLVALGEMLVNNDVIQYQTWGISVSVSFSISISVSS